MRSITAFVDKARDIGAFHSPAGHRQRATSSAVLARRYAVFRARQLPHTRVRVVCWQSREKGHSPPATDRRDEACQRIFTGRLF